MTRRTLTMLALAATLAASSQSSASARIQDQKALPSEMSSRHPGQAVNIKVDLIITEQREGTAATPKTITMLVADRDRGQMRSNGAGDQMLNVDVQPEIIRDGRVRLRLTFDYRAPKSETDRMPPSLTQSLTSIVDDGKPLMISQWTEPGSTRSVRVELRAAIQK